MCAMDWHESFGVLLSHTQCSQDRPWLHCDPDQMKILLHKTNVHKHVHKKLNKQVEPLKPLIYTDGHEKGSQGMEIKSR